MTHLPNRLVDRRKLLLNLVEAKRLKILKRPKDRASSVLIGNRLPERIWDNEDIREQDCGIEVEPTDRLQCHLRSKLGIKAKLQKGTGLLSYLPVLRKIASCLAHNPDRRRIDCLAGDRLDEFSTPVHRLAIFLIKES